MAQSNEVKIRWIINFLADVFLITKKIALIPNNLTLLSFSPIEAYDHFFKN